MTTIAFDGEIMAVDSRQTGWFIHADDVVKLRKIGRMVFACTGEAQDAEQFERWIRRGETKKKTPSMSRGFCALVVRRRKLYCYEDKLIACRVSWPYAVGSGSEGAMLAGANAELAVKIASKLDPYTGGEIRTAVVGKRHALETAMRGVLL